MENVNFWKISVVWNSTIKKMNRFRFYSKMIFENNFDSNLTFTIPMDIFHQKYFFNNSALQNTKIMENIVFCNFFQNELENLNVSWLFIFHEWSYP